MEELEEQISLINEKIAIEEYKEKNSLKKEQVIEYLTHQVRQNPKLMLYALIQKIVLFDDKVEIYFNYVKNYYPDDFSPEIARDSSFIECSIDFQSGAPRIIYVQFSHFAGVAQLAEQLICNQQVAGSSPITSSIEKYILLIKTWMGSRAAKGSRL